MAQQLKFIAVEKDVWVELKKRSADMETTLGNTIRRLLNER